MEAPKGRIQVSLPGVFVWAVALEAVLGKNRPHVPSEVDRLGSDNASGNEGDREQQRTGKDSETAALKVSEHGCERDSEGGSGSLRGSAI